MFRQWHCHYISPTFPHRDIFPQLQQLSGPGCLLATSLSSANTSFCSRFERQMFVQRKVFGDYFICCIELSITCSQCLFQKSQYGERVEVALNICETRMRWRGRRAGAGWWLVTTCDYMWPLVTTSDLHQGTAAWPWRRSVNTIHSVPECGFEDLKC